MKGFVLVLVLAVSLTAAQHLTEEQQKRAQAHAKACLAEIDGVSADAAKKVQSGDFSNTDDNTKCFTKCLMEKSGILNAQGELQEARTIEVLSRSGGKDKVTALVQSCKSNKSSDPCENAYAMYECYSKAKLL